ncbi:hypothetical protein C475_14533 [Halosimplex carlsbadense 2-9-1]|uniref:Uncharacterized protein n=1 Tax=Halosimplex carlsbadense 2-9-1 TaxID=797114 RepID=M0CLL0_9EURY|nr:hypothetical protein [Halosimplex carlsbadense]ELZ23498.1 hypothetical protein C475_14533 [Halosimplex carlsbadense 2-9-1]
MSAAGGPRIRRLFDRAAEAGDLRTVIFRGIGAVLFAGGSAVASGVLTLADLIIIPMTALGNSLGAMIEATFGGAAQIINISALATALSIGPGGMFNLGPLTFALGFAAVLVGLYLLNWYVSLDRTGNLWPGLPFDIPWIGDGPEEEQE